MDAIERVLDINSCDFLVTVDGSGVGRNDAMISMLARRGEVLVHEIALQPGSAAIGHFGMVTALAVPGLPDQALAVWLTLAVLALDQLCGRQPRNPVTRRLARKVASSVGVAEITLLKEKTTACDWQLIA